MAMPLWLREKLFLKDAAARGAEERWPRDCDWDSELLFTEHHQSHAASAFFPSPFEEAAVLTMDGVGEWATTSLGHRPGQPASRCCKEIHFPHSLGLAVLGLHLLHRDSRSIPASTRSWGSRPTASRSIAQTDPRATSIDLKADGSFRLDLIYFDYCTGLTMTNGKFDELFGGPPRKPDELLTQRHMDLAASIQAVTEEVVLRLTRSLAQGDRRTRICAWRAAWRSTAWPTARCCATAGSTRSGSSPPRAMPAARWAPRSSRYHMLHGPAAQASNGARRHAGRLSRAALFATTESRAAPARPRARSFDGARRRARLIDACAQALGRRARRWAGSRAGWSSGRARSAAARSSAIARSPTMQKTLNLKVKYRESFRPFAPVGAARAMSADWFELDDDSPYMLLVADVVEVAAARDDGSRAGAVRHRQAQRAALRHSRGDPRRLLGAHPDRAHGDQPALPRAALGVRSKTGCPVLVNTSFNVRGEPIVCTPEDAFRCFMGTEIDVLAVGNCYLRKEDQDPALQAELRDGVRARLSAMAPLDQYEVRAIPFKGPV